MQDPGQGNIVLTDLLPIKFSSCTSTSTQGSINISSGNVFYGGISINSTVNASSITNGGTFLTNGGASIAKDLYIGNSLFVNNTNLTPNPQDIFSTMTFSGQNNASNADITGLIFDNSVWGFDCYLSVRIICSTSLYTNFHIRGINMGSSWDIVKTYVGSDTGIQFFVTDYGQLQYSCLNYPGFISIDFRFRALTN